MSQETAGKLLVNYRAVIAEIVDAGGELNPETEAALVNIDVRMPAAVDLTAEIMERLEHEESYWKEKADAYARTAKGLSNMKSRIKDHLKTLMIETNTEELKGHDVRFKLSNSKPSLVINEDLLDDVYKERVTVVKPNKKLIEEELKLGIPVEGAVLVESKSFRVYANTKVGK